MFSSVNSIIVHRLYPRRYTSLTDLPYSVMSLPSSLAGMMLLASIASPHDYKLSANYFKTFYHSEPSLYIVHLWLTVQVAKEDQR